MICLGCVIIREQTDEALDGSHTLFPAIWVIALALVLLISELVMLLLHFLNPSCFNNLYAAFGGIVSNLCNVL